MCKSEGKAICKRADFCAPAGKMPLQLEGPKHGFLDGDVWAPAGDSFNEWVAVGTSSPGPRCGSHTECCGGPPQWGRLHEHGQVRGCACETTACAKKLRRETARVAGEQNCVFLEQSARSRH
jgi:hypothetical protein